MYDTAYTVALDIRREYCHTLLNARRGDAGRRLIITLTEGDDRYIPPEGTDAVLSARKPDGNLIYNSCTVREDGRLELKITPQMTAVPGLVECQIKLSWPDGSRRTGAGFALAVEDVVFDAGDIPGSASESTLIADILEKAGQAADLSGQAKQALADADAACQKALAAADRADAAADRADEAADNAAAGADQAQQAQNKATEALETARRADEKADAARQILSSLHSAIQVTARGTDTLVLTDSADGPLNGLALYGRTVRNADGSLTTAGAEDTEVSVSVSAGNLLPYPYADLAEGTQTVRGASVTVDGGSIRVSGTFTASGPSTLADLFLGAGTYIFSSEGKSGAAGLCHLQLLYLEGSGVGDAACDIVGAGAASRSFTLEKSAWVRARMICYKDAAVDVTFRPMIRPSGTGSAYSPYTGGRVTVPVSGGLPGIAVSSGGNYTDSQGQSWICDEIDFEKGVYIRRVGRKRTSEITGIYAGDAQEGGYAFYFTLPDGKTGGCLWEGRSRAASMAALQADTYFDRMNSAETRYLIYFFHSTASEAEALAALQAQDARLQYVLAEPVTEALAEDVLAAFGALRSFRPLTAAANSAGAVLELGYTADTKTYVDNKFAQLSAALVNS